MEEDGTLVEDAEVTELLLADPEVADEEEFNIDESDSYKPTGVDFDTDDDIVEEWFVSKDDELFTGRDDECTTLFGFEEEAAGELLTGRDDECTTLFGFEEEAADKLGRDDECTTSFCFDEDAAGK
jgi:hypothetical protein